MNKNNLLAAAAFTPGSIQSPDAWVGHLPFAAWLVKELAPAALVELGTHTGNSYFAFCQAIAEYGLSTKCYAVDTWQGDEHAGQYSDAVFSRVDEHNRDKYRKFSSLLRMTFDDALSYFSDQSIDVLHIDGLHTYDAVRHDFETWLPKLAPGGVILFHDTNVRERSFGVWKLWDQLKRTYPNNLEFTHSHGLGVLQPSCALNGKRLVWLQDEAEKKQLIDYFAALGGHQLERYALKSQIADCDERVASLSQESLECHRQIGALRASTSWRVTAPLRLVRRLLGRQGREQN